MGMLIKKPKYTPPAEMSSANDAIAEREKRAAVEEKRQLKELASRRKAMRRGAKGLLSPDRDTGMLGVLPTLTTETMNVRNPYDTGQRGPNI